MCRENEDYNGKSSSQFSRRRPASSISSTSIKSERKPEIISKEHTSSLQRWARQRRLVILLVVLSGFAGTGLFKTNINTGEISNQPVQFRVSEIQNKPRMVGYVDLRALGTIKSYYHEVIRIDLESQEWIPNKASARLNLTSHQPLWKWSKREIKPLSEEAVTAVSDDDDDEEGDCQLPHEWMKQQFPTCNNLHEQDMMRPLINQPEFLLGKGSMRTVWLLQQEKYTAVLKTLNLKRDFDDDNLNRHRRDAIISERLTRSPHFLNIYGHCGQSAVYEYADGGSLYDAIGAREYPDESIDEQAHADWETWTPRRKLEVVYQVVSAVADLHDIDGDGIPSVAHDDLDVTQFVSTDGGKTYRLSDFNGAPFIKYDHKKKQSCPFHALMKGGKTRSPEEYKREDVTEKLDIFAMGNVIYTILTGQYPFHDIYDTETKQNVISGVLPVIPEYIKEQKGGAFSSSIILHGLLNSMRLCWKYDPKERVSATKLKTYLKTIIDQVADTDKKDNKKHDSEM